MFHVDINICFSIKHSIPTTLIDGILLIGVKASDNVGVLRRLRCDERPGSLDIVVSASMFIRKTAMHVARYVVVCKCS